MKHLKFLIMGILALMLVFSFCKKENMDIDNPNDQENENVQQSEGLIVLGKQLEDPYALKNMKQAYSNLKSANSETPDIDIRSTHNYLRFLPKNEKEWATLKSDTSIVLYDYPLNYEIVNLGTYYHDPTLPDSAITWQYCVIPIEKSIPNVQNELLYEVYIPTEEDSTDMKSASVLKQFLIDLEFEANSLTGNLPKNETNLKSTNGLWSQWRPKGTIKVWDNVIGDYIPLIQASVHARWFTRVETDLTDDNGYFETGKFRNEVNYAIKWERADYDIRDGDLPQAWYNGPKQKGDWNLNIGTSGKSIMFATIHRAAYKHFYGDNLGIRRPTANGSTKLCYKDENGSGIFWGDWIDMGILPDIRVWGKNNGNYKPIDQVFSTTTHELGHQSHWHLIGVNNYAFTGKKIYESWADAVEWALTNDEYHKLGARFNKQVAKDYECPYTNQFYWPNVSQKEYSPIFIDLIDDVNQRNNVYLNGVLIHYGSTSYPNDLISGYTLSFLQDNILTNSRGYSSLRDEVKSHKIAGVTDNDIDELFILYWDN